jgi:Pyruvate/2-oxoacid:ferredoxin oxidoreductase delta subunit
MRILNNHTTQPIALIQFQLKLDIVQVYDESRSPWAGSKPFAEEESTTSCRLNQYFCPLDKLLKRHHTHNFQFSDVK